jgi:type II secretory pathway pseudopilin PulG
MLDERGFSLMEALTAATIAVIAVMGLAYSFGVGRGLVDRYETARAALGEAQSQLEALTLVAKTDPTLALGYVSPLTPFRYDGVTLGNENWRVVGYDDPMLSGTVDLKRVIVTVRWHQNAQTDSLSLERLCPL